VLKTVVDTPTIRGSLRRNQALIFNDTIQLIHMNSSSILIDEEIIGIELE
jgi:hypothetical protein